MSYAFADPADGPAFCFGCVPNVIFTLALQIHFDPPSWVHLVTGLPFMLLTCTVPLRPLKGWLVCSHISTRPKRAVSANPGRRSRADR